MVVRICLADGVATAWLVVASKGAGMGRDDSVVARLNGSSVIAVQGGSSTR
jgi:hypothetical protein